MKRPLNLKNILLVQSRNLHNGSRTVRAIAPNLADHTICSRTVWKHVSDVHHSPHAVSNNIDTSGRGDELHVLVRLAHARLDCKCIVR